VAENAKPMIAKLSRCVEGPQGAKLLAQQAKLRAEMATRRAGRVSADARAVAASASTRRRGE
jgi:type IV secretion system protein VirD4